MRAANAAAKVRRCYRAICGFVVKAINHSMFISWI